MIRFPCGKCGREFAVDNSFAGQTGSCSWCGAAMTVPQPYADGTKTDDLRDPEAAVEHARPGEHNPFQLPQYRQDHQYRYEPSGGGGGSNQLAGWGIFLLIIVIVNVILIPLTGWAIIPR